MSCQQHNPAALYPRERPGTHCTGGLVDPRAGLEGRELSSPSGFDPGPSRPWSVAIPTDLLGPHQSLIFLFNSCMTPCAHSATSCRQHLSTNLLLRTVKQIQIPAIQLLNSSPHTISSSVLLFLSRHVQWSKTNVVFDNHNRCRTRGKILGSGGVVADSHYCDI